MNSSKKLKLVEPEAPTVEQARAAVAAAEAARSEAAAAINAAVNAWPAPMNHRSMIVERRVLNHPKAFEDYTARHDGKAERDRYAAFDAAVEFEARVARDLEAARAALDEARKQEFGDGRQALAAAIEARTKATAAADTARVAVTRARAEVTQAEDRLGSAETAVEEAKAAHLAFMTSETDQLLSNREDVRRARREHADAVDDLDMAGQALATLKAAAEGAEETERRSGAAVEAAARAVLAEAVIPLLDGFDDELMEWKSKTLRRLQFVASGLPTMNAYNSPEARRAMQVNTWIQQVAGVGPIINLGRHGMDLFSDALAALKADARAQLPEVK